MNEYNKFYLEDYTLKNVDQIKYYLDSRINSIIEKNENSTNLTDYSYSDLSELAYYFERLGLSARSALEKKESLKNLGMCEDNNSDFVLPEDTELSENGSELLSSSLNKSFKPAVWNKNKDNYVDIFFGDDVLKVFTPETFKRFKRSNSLKENYILMEYVSANLKRWAEQNNVELHHLIPAPCTVIIKRKMSKFSRLKVCDNDNLENGRIVNTIFEAMGYSDNALNMDLVSCFRLCDPSEKEGMEFIVMPRDKFINCRSEYLDVLD